jgi:hypothetical protein
VRRWRWPAAIALAVIAVALVAHFLLLRDEAVAPTVAPLEATAAIGEGEERIAVGPDGSLLPGLRLPEDVSLPALPLAEPPKSGRLAGPVLLQARVLGAAPAALRPYLERSYYGESGVDVILDGGIELRFGDASQAARKWAAAATVLADPAITALDYVDLNAPNHPALGGEGHELPVLP